METSVKTKKMLLGFVSLILILFLVMLLAWVNILGTKKEVLVAKTAIPEGIEFTKDNIDTYFEVAVIPISDARKDLRLEATQENKALFIGKRAKFGRQPGDPIKFSYMKNKNGMLVKDKNGNLIKNLDMVDINIETDDIKYQLYLLYLTYGEKYIAKAIKLAPDEYFQAKGITKGKDRVKLKFIRDIDKRYVVVPRFVNTPILSFSGNAKAITDIVVALKENDANYFDLERMTSKKLIVEFEPFLTELISTDIGKKSVWIEEVDNEYKAGITRKVVDPAKETDIKNTLMNTQISVPPQSQEQNTANNSTNTTTQQGNQTPKKTKGKETDIINLD